MIQAQVIADSICNGHRITTMKVTMPRYILAEFNTHRAFSRNSASSRAIRPEKLIELIRNNPFIPTAWQKQHAGMQGTEYFGPRETFASSDPHNKKAPGIDADPITNLGPGSFRIIQDQLRKGWLWARDMALQAAEILSNSGVHYYPDGDTSKLTGDGRGLTKQLTNRLLEPFMWHTVLVTSTEWENFWKLRCPQYKSYDNIYRSRRDVLRSSDIADFVDYTKFTDLEWLKINQGQADIHMMATAEAMWDAFNVSTPITLKPGQWHVPFGDEISPEALYNIVSHNGELSFFTEPAAEIAQVALKIATACCAHVSYTVVGEEDKPIPMEKYIELHDRLKASGHWSPFEHCAQAMHDIDLDRWMRLEDNIPTVGWCRNFQGWIQYRALIDTKQ